MSTQFNPEHPCQPEDSFKDQAANQPITQSVDPANMAKEVMS